MEITFVVTCLVLVLGLTANFLFWTRFKEIKRIIENKNTLVINKALDRLMEPTMYDMKEVSHCKLSESELNDWDTSNGTNFGSMFHNGAYSASVGLDLEFKNVFTIDPVSKAIVPYKEEAFVNKEFVKTEPIEEK